MEDLLCQGKGSLRLKDELNFAEEPSIYELKAKARINNFQPKPEPFLHVNLLEGHSQGAKKWLSTFFFQQKIYHFPALHLLQKRALPHFLRNGT